MNHTPIDGLVAVVPIRSLRDGKSRLAAALTPETRAALTATMLGVVARATLESGAIATLAVVSPDPAALELAISLDPTIVPLRQDPDRPGLNLALDAGRIWALDRGAPAMVVLFGDLPLLTAGDVRNLTRRDAPVVLAPDRHGAGTNGLLLRFGGRAAATKTASDPFRFAFGPGSYARHVAEAHRLGLEAATSLVAGTAFDLDTPEDWRTLLARELVDSERAGSAPRWSGLIGGESRLVTQP